MTESSACVCMCVRVYARVHAHIYLYICVNIQTCAYDFACDSLNVACIFMYACIQETAS